MSCPYCLQPPVTGSAPLQFLRWVDSISLPPLRRLGPPGSLRTKRGLWSTWTLVWNLVAILIWKFSVYYWGIQTKLLEARRVLRRGTGRESGSNVISDLGGTTFQPKLEIPTVNWQKDLGYRLQIVRFKTLGPKVCCPPAKNKTCWIKTKFLKFTAKWSWAVKGGNPVSISLWGVWWHNLSSYFASLFQPSWCLVSTRQLCPTPRRH